MTLEERIDQLEPDFKYFKGKYEVQFGLVDDLRNKNEKLSTVTKECDTLCDRVEELESFVHP